LPDRSLADGTLVFGCVAARFVVYQYVCLNEARQTIAFVQTSCHGVHSKMRENIHAY